MGDQDGLRLFAQKNTDWEAAVYARPDAVRGTAVGRARHESWASALRTARTLNLIDFEESLGADDSDL